MSNIQMSRETLIKFIVVYCETAHISREDKREMLEETLDQFYNKIKELENKLQIAEDSNE